MNNGKVVITGATSFIGNALIRRFLARNDYEIIAVVRPNSLRRSSIGTSERVKIVESDLEGIDKVDEKLYDAEALFHVGWSSDFENARYNLEGQMQNVAYLEKVFLLAREINCRKIIVVGSQAECGRVSSPISELTPDNPETAYAIAKCRAYERGMELCGKYGINLYWPRLLSAYGPNDKMRTLIMSCLDAATRKNEICLTKCEQIWDYIYVDDVAEALIKIMDKGVPGIKYTIASGKGRRLSDYISEIAEISQSPLLLNGIGKKEYSNDQVMYLVGDISRLRADTGFDASVTFRRGIEEILRYNFL